LVTDWDAAAVTVDEGASIGAMATIVSGVRIGAWALVGAGAVVTRDVPSHTVVTGVPAEARGYVCRCARSLDETFTCSEGHRFRWVGDTLEMEPA
jgi:UDP-2-acetamido-3-amino-2,3-dideoxy-glucuronate N-acetyltransferase